MISLLVVGVGHLIPWHDVSRHVMSRWSHEILDISYLHTDGMSYMWWADYLYLVFTTPPTYGTVRTHGWCHARGVVSHRTNVVVRCIHWNTIPPNYHTTSRTPYTIESLPIEVEVNPTRRGVVCYTYPPWCIFSRARSIRYTVVSVYRIGTHG